MKKISRRALLLGAGAATGGAAVHFLGPSRPVLDGSESQQANPYPQKTP